VAAKNKSKVEELVFQSLQKCDIGVKLLWDMLKIYKIISFDT